MAVGVGVGVGKVIAEILLGLARFMVVNDLCLCLKLIEIYIFLNVNLNMNLELIKFCYFLICLCFYYEVSKCINLTKTQSVDKKMEKVHNVLYQL